MTLNTDTLIRSEIGMDIPGVSAVEKAAFETDAEMRLVEMLREDGLLTLSLVAVTDEGEVVGHAAFSPVEVEGSDGNWQGLAPVAVHPDWQGKGIGAALVEEGISTLGELGYPAVVVLGDPLYYRRFGFETAADYGLLCHWPVPPEAFMVLPLQEGVLEGVKGQVAYSEPFSKM